ncbi:hypothetical protein J2S43_005209 [Catenuloplanes nepalensis]|uniref:Uncharacterized protein n=1 Tax=Catenuloplanes nepalensis TaxID=587533 RepID=A0ABT9MZ35_9ACTN|nr:hypothetical protein [Catenuloplanes nepalensis]MDP9796697.1 hypothetical protein [Catenuloplanes nepalensis]
MIKPGSIHRRRRALRPKFSEQKASAELALRSADSLTSAPDLQGQGGVANG